MKDYDSTLARMAGNIAAGLVAETNLIMRPSVEERIADVSMSIASRIIAKCKANYAKLPVDTEQAMQGKRS